MSSAFFFQLQSTLILVVFGFGIFAILRKKNRLIHAKTMAFGVFWDFVLILQIEFNRKAIEKALKAPSNPLILNVHIFFALTSVFLYFFMLYTGLKILKGHRKYSKRHKLMGKITLAIRVLTYITSFWAV
jgi:hypothetical protein